MRTVFYRKENEPEKVYEISYDEELLETCRNKVIEDFSEVDHHDYISYYSPLNRKKPYPKGSIKNYRETPAGVRFGIDVFRYQFDTLKFPHLVELIDNITSATDVEKSIDGIMNPDYTKEKIPIIDEIKETRKRIWNEKFDSVEEQKQLLEQLKHLLEQYNNGEYEIPIKKYYEAVQSIFSIQQKEKENEIIK